VSEEKSSNDRDSNDTARPATGPRTPSSPHKLTDPLELRALAHPTRITLLGLLGVHGTMTATQAAEILDTTPASTAYHLRTLAKYGFVEDAEGGSWRERPWRATKAGLSFSWDDNVEDAGQRAVARALSEVVYDMWIDQFRHYQATKDTYPAEIREISGASGTTLFATPEEVAQAQQEISAILDRFKDRGFDPDLRPVGQPPIEMVMFTYPIPLPTPPTSPSPSSPPSPTPSPSPSSPPADPS
jgi:predicted ArsR family transcriptional regulator